MALPTPYMRFRFWAAFGQRGAATDAARMLGERDLGLASVESRAGRRLVLRAPHLVGRPSLRSALAQALPRGNGGELSVWMQVDDGHGGGDVRRIDAAFSRYAWRPFALSKLLIPKLGENATAQDTLVLFGVRYRGPYDESARAAFPRGDGEDAPP